MDIIHALAEHFARFPGIGNRQAKRFVYFLLRQDKAYVRELSSLIESLKNSVIECTQCHRFFVRQEQAQGNTCNICTNPERDRTTLMIVEKDSDFEAIERGGNYRGLYFILGGTLPILEKKPDAKIRISHLIKLIKNSPHDLKEIIIACAFTPEGEHTREYVESSLTSVLEGLSVKITALGRGLSTGTELEYSDNDTLRYALENRK